MSNTIEITDVGPIEHLEMPIPEGGGITVLRGRNGTGKTEALEAVDRLTGGQSTLSVRDGELKGRVAGFGAVLTVARSTTRRGTLEVVSLQGRLSIADLVQPPIKDPAAADAMRIKALVSLAGAKADPALFHEIAGGAEKFAEVMPLAEADDLVALASKVKREFEGAARRQENAAEKAKTAATVRRESIGDIDLSEPLESEAVYGELQAATKLHTQLTERQQAADEAGDRATEARAKLATAEKAHEGPTIEETGKAVELALTSTQGATNSLEDAQRAVGEAEVALQAALSTERDTTAAHNAAEQHATAMAAWRETLDADVPAPPELADLAEASVRLGKARAVVGDLTAYQQAKQHQSAASRYDLEATEHTKSAERSRDVARGTDDVLSEVVGKLGTPLRVQAGRLVLKTKRSDNTYFHELSPGERWREGLDIAIEVAGERTLFTIPQVAWEGLDPINRAEVARNFRRKKVNALAAQSSADEEVKAEVYEEPDGEAENV